MIGLALFATWATLGLNAAGHYWHGRPDPCPHTYVAAIAAGGQAEAGNFRDDAGDCLVWLNTDYAPYTPGQVCKLIIHEVGHLRGLPHSTNPRSVMFAPFHDKPTPAACRRHR